MAELILTFWKHAETYYRKPDGTRTSELNSLKQAFRPLKEIYGDTQAEAFGPQEFKTVRQAMIARAGFENQSIGGTERQERASFEREHGATRG